MPINGTIDAITEHTIVKAAMPFLVAASCALSTWLFTSVLSLEQQVKLLNEGTVHNLEEKVDGLAERIDEMNRTLTDLRVSLGGRNRDRRDLHDDH